jgi:zinc and cadmium transporter
MHPLDIHWVLTFASVALVACVSLAGMLALSVSPGRLARVVPALVSLAAGALLGTAFGHLLPESVERWGSGRALSAILAASFASFFILEKAIHLYLQRTRAGKALEHDLENPNQLLAIPPKSDASTEQDRSAVVGLLCGAGIHSFIDGMAMATGYAAGGTRLGLITTVAILLHEAPHHIGDVSILIHLGTPIKRSVLLNLMVGSTSAIGALLVLLLGEQSVRWTSVLLPFTTANFIYIASASLMPELQHERDVRQSLRQVLFLVLGCLVMLLISYSSRE